MFRLNTLPLSSDMVTPQLRSASRLALLLDAMGEEGVRTSDAPIGALQRIPGQQGAVLAALATGESQAATGLSQQAGNLAAAVTPNLSEAARMLASLGMRPRSALELMLDFNRTGEDGHAAGSGVSASNGAGPGENSGMTGTSGVHRRLADIAPEELATLLRSVITRSGLFYESHLHDWVRGRRPLSDLAAQPQMRVPRDAGAQLQESGPQAIPAQGAINDRPAGPIPEPLQDIVARQLDVLDTRQLHLHLATGAERPVELMIGQEKPQDTIDSDGGTWVAELNCQLPELGEVKARLRLQGTRLAIAITAEDADRSDWLDARLGELRIMLERSGLAAPQLDVDHDARP